jgi:acyl-coenzyme A thioesterase PaaI-like protein
MSKMKLKKDTSCFVCGEKNKDGLQLRIQRDGDRGVKTEFVADNRYRGWANYLHGGVIGLIFDELLGWNARYLGYDAMTARMEIRYRRPIPVGSRIIFQGTVEKESNRILEMRTHAYLEDGSLAAEGRGKMMIINQREE